MVVTTLNIYQKSIVLIIFLLIASIANGYFSEPSDNGITQEYRASYNTFANKKVISQEEFEHQKQLEEKFFQELNSSKHVKESFNEVVRTRLLLALMILFLFFVLGLKIGGNTVKELTTMAIVAGITSLILISTFTACLTVMGFSVGNTLLLKRSKVIQF